MVLYCLIKAAMKAGQVMEVLLMSRGPNDGGIANVQTELGDGQNYSCCLWSGDRIRMNVYRQKQGGYGKPGGNSDT